MPWLRLVLVGLLAVVPVASAEARPLVEPFVRGPKKRLPTIYENVCELATWPKVTACLRKVGKVTVVQALEGARLVAVRPDPTLGHANVFLYVEREKRWRRANTNVTLTAGSELLGFSRLDGRPGYRIEVGMITQASHSFDAVSSTPLMLSRRFTTVCGVEANDCRSVMTACDAFIGGKAYWTFRGEVAWQGSALKVKGDTTHGGRLCTPPKGVLADAD